MTVLICYRCCCVDTYENPVEAVVTPEGYFIENVCLECLSSEGETSDNYPS